METRKEFPLASPGRHHEGKDDEVIWVHLCSGEIVGVQPATDVRVVDDRLVILDREKVVGTFFRDEVYYTCRDGDACPTID
jgi:hypothetical protein